MPYPLVLPSGRTVLSEQEPVKRRAVVCLPENIPGIFLAHPGKVHIHKQLYRKALRLRISAATRPRRGRENYPWDLFPRRRFHAVPWGGSQGSSVSIPEAGPSEAKGTAVVATRHRRQGRVFRLRRRFDGRVGGRCWAFRVTGSGSRGLDIGCSVVGLLQSYWCSRSCSYSNHPGSGFSCSVLGVCGYRF